MEDTLMSSDKHVHEDLLNQASGGTLSQDYQFYLTQMMALGKRNHYSKEEFASLIERDWISQRTNMRDFHVLSDDLSDEDLSTVKQFIFDHYDRMYYY